MGVMTLVAPGPDVTSTTPGFPDARAYLKKNVLESCQTIRLLVGVPLTLLPYDLLLARDGEG